MGFPSYFMIQIINNLNLAQFLSAIANNPESASIKQMEQLIVWLDQISKQYNLHFIIITCIHIHMKTDLTYFQELIEQDSKVEVLCQTDLQFNSVANQCSWCSTQFVLNRKELLKLYSTDKAKFTDLYNSCIAVGTEMRRQHGQLPCGENADNQDMLRLTLNDFALTKLTYSENDFILLQLAPYIPPFALQEFNGRKHTPISELKLRKEWDYVMLGRHGQTFTVLPYGENYLVLDSHVHFVGVMNEKNLTTYIKMERSGGASYGYLFVTIVGGTNQAE